MRQGTGFKGQGWEGSRTHRMEVQGEIQRREHVEDRGPGVGEEKAWVTPKICI